MNQSAREQQKADFDHYRANSGREEREARVAAAIARIAKIQQQVREEANLWTADNMKIG